MNTSRLEAFSDGVLAIVITIMVLEFEVPDETSFHALVERIPKFLSYLVSFIYVGIYWNSHHHVFQASEKLNGKVLWSNLHLLFWLSLIPFATAWIGKNFNATAPTVLYGFILFMSSVAFRSLVNNLMKHHEGDFALKKAIGNRKKEKISLLIYVLGISLSFYSSFAGIFCYVFVAMIWFVPDRRIERLFS